MDVRRSTMATVCCWQRTTSGRSSQKEAIIATGAAPSASAHALSLPSCPAQATFASRLPKLDASALPLHLYCGLTERRGEEFVCLGQERANFFELRIPFWRGWSPRQLACAPEVAVKGAQGIDRSQSETSFPFLQRRTKEGHPRAAVNSQAWPQPCCR